MKRFAPCALALILLVVTGAAFASGTCPADGGVNGESASGPVEADASSASASAAQPPPARAATPGARSESDATAAPRARWHRYLPGMFK